MNGEGELTVQGGIMVQNKDGDVVLLGPWIVPSITTVPDVDVLMGDRGGAPRQIVGPEPHHRPVRSIDISKQ